MSQQTDTTLAPWSVDYGSDTWTIRDTYGSPIAVGDGFPDDPIPRRIVACVNACAGIDDPAELRAQRDELLNVCTYIEDCCPAGPAVPDELVQVTITGQGVRSFRAAIARAKGPKSE